MQKTLILILTILTLFGCTSSENQNEVQIRISNVSEYNYKNIIVNASGEIVAFGNLKANSNSEYKIFDLAYRYAYVEFQIDGKIFTLQPIDYVGELPLKHGKYSYEINVDPNSQFQKVTLNLKVD